MKNIILIGMKGCGKTTIGKILAEQLKIYFIDMDAETEKMLKKTTGENLTYREMFKKYGEKYFSEMETKSLSKIEKKYKKSNFVLACGGRTALNKKNQQILKKMGKLIYLKPDKEALYIRIIKNGIPSFFPYPEDPRKSFEELLKQRELIYEKIANVVLHCGVKTPEEIINIITIPDRKAKTIPDRNI